MKKVSKIISVVFAFIILLDGQLLAIVNPTFNYNDNQTLVVELNDWKNKALTLEIIDKDGKSIYTDLIRQEYKTTKEYNLKDLTVGDYFIVLYGEKKRTISGFSKGIDGIHVVKEVTSDLFQPKIDISSRKVSIDYTAYGEDVRVSIIGQKGIAFATSFEGQYFVDEKINISNLGNGSFVLVLTSGNHVVRVPFIK
jgi:hypothetical protein